MDELHPEPTDPGEMARRGFLKRAIGILSMPLGVVTVWPLVSSLIAARKSRAKVEFTRVPGLDTVPVGQPARLTFGYLSQDAYTVSEQIEDVWVIRHSDTEVTAFSPICTHLSCRVAWQAAARQFVCPCHGSIFSMTGQRIEGPAPRGLDTLPYKIEDGELYVQWIRYRPGEKDRVRV